MLASYPGFHQVTPRAAVAYEIEHGESHSFQLADDFFGDFEQMLLIMKMHLNGTPQNAKVLHLSGIKYVILFRDLRDVAVSYSLYVSRTPWHPDYRPYQKLTVQEMLAKFAETHLLAYSHWIELWHENRDPELSLMARYEDLRSDPEKVLQEVASHFGIDSSPDLISDLIKRYALDQSQGEGDEEIRRLGSVVRKGIIGDWANYFSSDLKMLYKQKIGQFLIDYGYEADLDW